MGKSQATTQMVNGGKVGSMKLPPPPKRGDKRGGSTGTTKSTRRVGR